MSAKIYLQELLKNQLSDEMTWSLSLLKNGLFFISAEYHADPVVSAFIVSWVMDLPGSQNMAAIHRENAHVHFCGIMN